MTALEVPADAIPGRCTVCGAGAHKRALGWFHDDATAERTCLARSGRPPAYVAYRDEHRHGRAALLAWIAAPLIAVAAAILAGGSVILACLLVVPIFAAVRHGQALKYRRHRRGTP